MYFLGTVCIRNVVFLYERQNNSGKEKRMKNQEILDSQIIQEEFCLDKKPLRDEFPFLLNMSAAFMYQFLPSPKKKLNPEFVYIAAPKGGLFKTKTTKRMVFEVFITEWNMAWEANALREKIMYDKLPKSLEILKRYKDKNIFILPIFSCQRYEAYSPLLHLLPLKTCERFGLPTIRKGLWPHMMHHWYYDELLPKDFDLKLSQAFAFHVWPYLNSGSKINSFTGNDPIRILAHNLDFWLPYIYQVAENRLKTFPRAPFDNDKQFNKLIKINNALPNDVQRVNRPYKGGTVWRGEDDAWEATKEMVNIADSKGHLRDIIDAVKSNRIQDDFSKRWSYAKEDFERKIYHKRSKIKVTFVELRNTIPVHGPESEISENLIWEDFLALLNKKEKSIVICLRSGKTKLGEISKELGYANHSPVSKALKKIRNKAISFFEE